MKRRNFIASASLLASTGTVSAAAKKPLLHHVFFWLNNPNSEADKKQLIEGLKRLKGIPTIKEIHIGTLASTEKREVVDTSWDVSELMFFTTCSAVSKYGSLFFSMKIAVPTSST